MSENGGERRAQYAEAIGNIKESFVIDEEKPVFVGEGSDHAVFALEGLAGAGEIAKVNVRSVVSAIRENQKRGKMLNFLESGERERIREYKESIDASIARMRSHFGEAVLSEHVTVRQIPMTNELLEVMTHGDPNRPQMLPGTHEAIALVTLQKRAPEAAFYKGSSSDLRTRYLEWDNTPPLAVYEAINRACIDNPDGMECGKMLEEVVGDIIPFRRAERDPVLHESLKDFVGRAIRFSNSTGDQLDMAGQHNVRTYKDNNGLWKTVIIDGRYIPGRFNAVAPVVEKLVKGEEVSLAESRILLNGLAYTRFVNAAAARLGVPDRLKVSPVRIARMSQKLLDILKAPKKS